MKQKIQIISNIVIVMALAAVAYHFNEKYSELNEANKQQELQNTALQVKYSDSKQRIETLEETITDLQNGVVRLAEVDRLKIKSIRVEDFALVSKNGKELITMKSYPNRTFMMLDVS
jgi:predicted nuclease with TOPRIM domain